MHSALDIAKWFVAYGAFIGADRSNLKLQKLLYYAQGHYLATAGKPLFKDEIEAWSHGPVVADVYHAFKGRGSSDLNLPPDDPFRFDQIDVPTQQYLLQVWEAYAKYGAWSLREMTHKEAPWLSTFKKGIRHQVIPKEVIKAHFKQFHPSVTA